MREKIVLRRQLVPVPLNLHNGTSFVSRYKRISRKQLPGNIRVSRTATVGPRNKRKTKKKVRFALANTTTHNRARRIEKNWKLRRVQIGKGLADKLANLRISLGRKAIDSVIGKKTNK